MERNMKKRKRNLLERAGFTIIELLVVVVVMGILGMVAVTRYLVAQDRAHVKIAVCL